MGWLLILQLGQTVQLGPVHADEALVRRARQLVLVIAASWSSSDGTARRYERDAPGQHWRAVGGPFPVRLGRSGLGWRGDAGAPPPPPDAPLKREGDGRSPAGALPLGEMWGYDETAPAGVLLPYHAARPSDRCVDDPEAPHYGQLVEAPASPPWRSAERMLRPDGLYRYLLVVRYNMDRPLPAVGSCIFVHLWDKARSPTSGCTAMAVEDLLRLARWLRPDTRPVLVQLPAPVYARLRRTWGLP
ncbi:MAG: hypothetical protein NZ890_08335 [Myxococcota bacterium]|nr:hypothetical protein [Myxococcota bacterium]